MGMVRTEWLVVLVAMAVLAGVVALIVAVNPVPPTELTISTGSEGGVQYNLALDYQRLLEEEGFTLNILPGGGSAETVERLVSGEADIGFVSTGIVREEQAASLTTLGSLYLEPIWTFYRAEDDIRYLSDLRGKRVLIGPEGSGTQLTALRLLEANDVTAANSTFLDNPFQEMAGMLQAGEADALFFIVAPDTPMVQDLVRDETIGLINMERGAAYRSLYPYLTTVTISVGSLGLADNLPAEPRTLLAGAANLVAREDVHPNLVRLLSRVLTQVHSEAGVFSEVGEFPSASYTDLDLHPEAQRYLREGETFFEASFPFVVASILDRFIIVLIPLVPLLYPLIQGLPPVYNMAIRRRIVRWYRTLHEIDQKADQLPAHQIDDELKRLNEITDTLAKSPPPPLARMGDYYNLQLHIDLVAKRLEARRQELQAVS